MITRSFLFLLIFVFAFSCSKKKKDEIVARPVKYIEISNVHFDKTYVYSGISKAKQEADLSFKVNGTVDRFYVTVGSEIRKNQHLAKLDATDFLVSRNHAYAALKNAQAILIRTKSEYFRSEKLYATNSISLSDFETAKAQYEAAIAGVQSAQAGVRNAENQLSYTHLKAPFDGVITAKTVDEDERIVVGQTVLTINSHKQLEVNFGVPETVIKNIVKGNKAKVFFPTLEKKEYDAVITKVGYNIDVGSTYPVTVELKKEFKELRPGMPADVTLHFDTDEVKQDKSAIYVPVESVGQDEKGYFVLVIEPAENDFGVIKRQAVEVGEITGVGYKIREGLSPGKKIATAGLNNLYEGMKVKFYIKKRIK